MNIDIFTQNAKNKGFDTVAAMPVDKAIAVISEWKNRWRDSDFVGFLSTDPRDILRETLTLLLLTYPYSTFDGYPGGIGQISGYYLASNRAYHAADELADELQSGGINAKHTHKLPLKPLAVAAGLGRYGRNGLVVRNGTHIVLSLILADVAIELPDVQVQLPDCENCGRCEAACPTGCLSGGYVQADRCLRAYMTKDFESTPVDLRSIMGERLLGCDECLNACPGMKRDKIPEQFCELFAWDVLADREKFAKKRDAISELVGINNTDALHKSAIWRCNP